jgi:hypothetical protein
MIGTEGRNYLGMRGRLASESAFIVQAPSHKLEPLEKQGRFNGIILIDRISSILHLYLALSWGLLTHEREVYMTEVMIRELEVHELSHVVGGYLDSIEQVYIDPATVPAGFNAGQLVEMNLGYDSQTGQYFADVTYEAGGGGGGGGPSLWPTPRPDSSDALFVASETGGRRVTSRTNVTVKTTQTKTHQFTINLGIAKYSFTTKTTSVITIPGGAVGTGGASHTAPSLKFKVTPKD